MSKNIVVIPAVTPKDKKLDKFGGWNWMDISKNAWKYWCDKNGYELVIYDKCKRDNLDKYRVTIQRWFDIHDFLENKNIDYDKVLMADACSIPKWDCPDFFKLIGNNLGVSIERDNLKWVYESIQGYKNIFDNFNLDIHRYVNSGFVIFNKSHKELFKKFEDFYIKNIDEFVELQTKKVKRGTCQTPLNYFIQMDNVEVDFLPLSYRVSHLARKEFLSYNWQLQEDNTPFFIKHANIWVFSGFAKEHRNKLMEQTWELVKNNYE
tara:strand:+ start:1217 stop:2008 length:792 start_codon:yes stop_codon:yes gene_type:complete